MRYPTAQLLSMITLTWGSNPSQTFQTAHISVALNAYSCAYRLPDAQTSVRIAVLCCMQWFFAL